MNTERGVLAYNKIDHIPERREIAEESLFSMVKAYQKRRYATFNIDGSCSSISLLGPFSEENALVLRRLQKYQRVLCW